MSARSGYAWEWEQDTGSGAGRLILYRGHHRPDSEEQAFGWGSREEWRIDPVRHGTLRGVLEAWSARAGWTLVWEAEEVDYALHAPAVFLGTFDAAVDALLRENKGPADADSHALARQSLPDGTGGRLKAPSDPGTLLPGWGRCLALAAMSHRFSEASGAKMPW